MWSDQDNYKTEHCSLYALECLCWLDLFYLKDSESVASIVSISSEICLLLPLDLANIYSYYFDWSHLLLYVDDHLNSDICGI